MRSAGESRTTNTAGIFQPIVFRLDMSLEVGGETSLVAALFTGEGRIPMFTIGMYLQSSVSCGRIITGVTLEFPFLMNS